MKTLLKRATPVIDKNAPGMDSPSYYTKSKPMKNKKLSPKKADKDSKQIQSGRAAEGGKVQKKKLLPRVSLKKGKKTYPTGKIEKKESNIK